MDNPAPNNLGDEDDLLCWAASAANMLEYTGWGFVNGIDTADEFLDYFEDHVMDRGSSIDQGLVWWFLGAIADIEDVDHGGFWLDYADYWNYIHVYPNHNEALNKIEITLAGKGACGIGVDEIAGDGLHAITVWGLDIDDTKDPWDQSRYKGIFVSDSDSHKGDANAEDYLRYFSVEFDSANDYWYMPSYGGGWFITDVVGLNLFPGASRPVADCLMLAANTEGTPVYFDGSGSTDPSGDALSYRWDFDGDGKWDTEWGGPDTTHLWTNEYTGTAYLQVFDGRLTDICPIDIVVENVEPEFDLSFSDMIIDEGTDESITVEIHDPGVDDLLSVQIDWGDGTI